MKKKSKKIIMLLCALVLLLSIGTGGYTYAKYITSEKGNGQAEIAKWSFVVGTDTESIKNVKLVNTVESSSLVNGKIAPGTSGAFYINIDGTDSDVGIDYEVKFANEKNKPTNIVFRYAGKDYKSLAEMGDEIKGNIPLDSNPKTRRIQIMWRWEYETGTGDEITTNDNIDTQEGISCLDYTFDIIVTGKQSRI